MSNDYFTRPLTNADKAALLVLLVNGVLPDYGDTEEDALAWALMALSGLSKEAADAAFKDAERFKWIKRGEVNDVSDSDYDSPEE